MQKLIIVKGFIATLKSTISKRLGEDLNLLCLNKDEIKEMLGDSIGFRNREENLKLSRATFLLMKFITEKELAIGHNLIIESNFKTHEVDELKEVINFSETEVLTLFMTGDVEILFKRYKKRQENRHPVHKSTGLISFETFKTSMKEYDSSNYLGNVIVVDTSNFIDKDYMLVLKAVEDFIGK